jgi:hypothetical protein
MKQEKSALVLFAIVSVYQVALKDVDFSFYVTPRAVKIRRQWQTLVLAGCR